MGKKTNYFISLTVGILIFVGVIWYYGPETLYEIKDNIHPIYLIPYLFFTNSLFIVNTWRMKIIMKAYGRNGKFLTLLKQHIACYTISYLTPAARIGGEPLRAYMMKNENKMNIKTASSAVIMDKFIELFGSLLLGIFGLILLFIIPGIPLGIKIILGLAVGLGTLLLSYVYYQTILGKGPFTKVLGFLKFFKIKKFHKFSRALKDVEQKMAHFFINHKKPFMYSLFFYGLYGVGSILELKYLFLIFGIDATLTEVVLALVMWGAIGFIPVPAALGFQEAGQVSLFEVLNGNGEQGLLISLLVRIRMAIVVAVGLAIITKFSGDQILKKAKGSLKIK